LRDSSAHPGRLCIGTGRSTSRPRWVKAHGAQEIARADTLLEDVQRAEERNRVLYAATVDILMREAEKSPKLALEAIRTANGLETEWRHLAEFRGELTREKEPPGPVIDVGFGSGADLVPNRETIRLGEEPKHQQGRTTRRRRVAG
jgi:hypothetical protein